MAKEMVLIVDDDPDILDVLTLTLCEFYEVFSASNGQKGLELVKTKGPDLIITDYKMPVMDGRQFCQALKKDILLRHIPVIMLTGKGEIKDKIDGIDAGADDYLVKPFEPNELLARIKMILRRTERSLDANPLTHLPGNVSIMDEIQHRITKGKAFAVGYADLDKFKSYNDKYGFERGDDVIRQTANVLIHAINDYGMPDGFVGHVGGDDFVFVCDNDKADQVSQAVIKAFDALAPNFYNESDRKSGFILAKDRQGNEIKMGFLSISISLVSNAKQRITHIAQVGEIGAELKKYAKSLEGSVYVRDKRNN